MAFALAFTLAFAAAGLAAALLAFGSGIDFERASSVRDSCALSTHHGFKKDSHTIVFHWIWVSHTYG